MELQHSFQSAAGSFERGDSGGVGVLVGSCWAGRLLAGEVVELQHACAWGLLESVEDKLTGLAVQ